MSVTIRRREAILANLKTVLEAVTTGNGYEFSVAKVERVVRHYDDASARPFPYVCFSAGLREEWDHLGSGLAHVKMEVPVRCFFHGSSLTSDGSASGDSELSHVVDALERAVMADPTRGGYAFSTLVTGAETNEGVEAFDGSLPIRAVELTLEIMFERHTTTAT